MATSLNFSSHTLIQSISKSVANIFKTCPESSLFTFFFTTILDQAIIMFWLNYCKYLLANLLFLLKSLLYRTASQLRSFSTRGQGTSLLAPNPPVVSHLTQSKIQRTSAGLPALLPPCPRQLTWLWPHWPLGCSLDTFKHTSSPGLTLALVSAC